MTTNHTNPPNQRLLAILEQLQDGRGFFPTDRQRQLYHALLSAPCPAPETTQDADRLTLLGYGGAMGGAKTRHLPSSPARGRCRSLLRARIRRQRGAPAPSPSSDSPNSKTEVAAPPYKLMTDSQDQ